MDYMNQRDKGGEGSKTGVSRVLGVLGGIKPFIRFPPDRIDRLIEMMLMWICFLFSSLFACLLALFGL
jgi:hypothetical protein